MENQGSSSSAVGDGLSPQRSVRVAMFAASTSFRKSRPFFCFACYRPPVTGRGFRVYGTEPDALCIDGVFHDADLMVRFI